MMPLLRRLRHGGRQGRRKRVVLVLFLLALCLTGVVYLLAEKAKAPSPDTQQQPQAQSPTPNKTTLRLIATGDMLPHETVTKAAKTTDGYDYAPFFSQLKQQLTSADLAFCNQEAPSAPSFNPAGYPTFNAPVEFAKALSGTGCNVINLANNHSNDKGQTGINETRQVWEGLPTLAVAGTARSQAEQDKISFFEKSGIRFAFLSYTKCSNSSNVSSYGLNMLTRELVDRQVAAAKQQADMIIAGVHWCRENTSAQDSEQETWGQYFADKGVDIVIGTGPHWLQPVKRFAKAGGGETVNWFSLGNFLSTQEEVNGLIGGIAVMDIDIATKTVTKLGFLPSYMHYEWTPAQKAAGNLLARKNLMLYPLDQAAEPLAKSLNNTTVEQQTARVTQLLNTYTPVDILTSTTFNR